MPYTPLGKFGGSLGYQRKADFRRPVTFYDRVRFVGADSTLEIFGGALKGDLFSSDWDGGFDLSTASDATATAGYLLDWDSGSAQFEGNVFVGGRVELDGGIFATDTAATEPRIEIDGDGILNSVSIYPNGAFDVFHVGASANQPYFTGTPRYIWVADSETIMQLSAATSIYATDTITLATGQVLNGAGTAASPAYSFESDPDTGMYRYGTNALGFATGGSYDMLMGGGQVSFLVGSASAPSITFAGDSNTGMYRVGADRLGFATNGTHVAEFNAGKLRTAVAATGSPEILFGSSTGSKTAPVYSFQADSDTGIYRATSNGLSITTGGFEGFHVGGTTGAIYMHGVPANHTTGTAANMNIATTSPGQVKRSTSARKYKTQERPAPELADIVLRPTHFWRDDDQRFFYGQIADDLADQEPLLGVYTDDGEIENYDDRAVMAVMAAKINRLERQIMTLTNKPDSGILEPT